MVECLWNHLISVIFCVIHSPPFRVLDFKRRDLFYCTVESLRQPSLFSIMRISSSTVWAPVVFLISSMNHIGDRPVLLKLYIFRKISRNLVRS